MPYDTGFKRRGKNGEELFVIARRHRCGEKGAGKGWGTTRTKETSRCSCRVCSSGPCLNVVVRWGKEGKPVGCKMDGFEGEKSGGEPCLNPSNLPSSPNSNSPLPSSFSTAKEKVTVTSQSRSDFDKPVTGSCLEIF
jgi:hypothetical protein